MGGNIGGILGKSKLTTDARVCDICILRCKIIVIKQKNMDAIEAAWYNANADLPFSPNANAEHIVQLVRICPIDKLNHQRVLQWMRFVHCLYQMERLSPPRMVSELAAELHMRSLIDKKKE